MTREAETWLRTGVKGHLRRVGLREGQRVLDFGARQGMYAVPAALVVGESGWVYAADKDQEALQQAGQRAADAGVDNLSTVQVTDGETLSVPAESIDVVLLYDTLHHAYFPEARQRIRLLRRLQRTLKPAGLLVCHLTHVKQGGLTYRQLLGEFDTAGFAYQDRSRCKVIHDDHLVRGPIFRFRKPGDSAA